MMLAETCSGLPGVEPCGRRHGARFPLCGGGRPLHVSDRLAPRWRKPEPLFWVATVATGAAVVSCPAMNASTPPGPEGPEGPEPRTGTGPAPVPERGPLTVPEAARTLGISERAVRKRIQAGTLRATPRGRSFDVYLPGAPAGTTGPEGPERDRSAGERGPEPAAHERPSSGPGPEPPPASSRAGGGESPPASGPEPAPRGTGTGPEPGPEPIEARFRVTPAEIERAVERTGARYLADMETILNRVGRVYEGQLAAKDETIAELRRRAEAAEAERDALRERLEAAQATPAATEAPTVLIVEGDGHTHLPPLWQRLWRGLRGP